MTLHEQPLSRRGFLALAGAAGAAALLTGPRWPSLAAGSMCTSTVPEEQIGIQLFTCTAANATSPDATLQTLAGLGYRLVEHAGYGDDAAAFRQAVDDAGLRCVSGHTALPRPFDEDRVREIVADALVIGQRYIVWPSASGASTVADWIEVAEVMNRAGRIALKEGMGRHAVGFHNHAVEYQPIDGDPEGRRPIDILMRHCDPRLTHQQLDIGWCWSASNPVLELHRYPGRFRQLHVKDMVGVPPERRHLPGAGQLGVPVFGSAVPVLPGCRHGRLPQRLRRREGVAAADRGVPDRETTPRS